MVKKVLLIGSGPMSIEYIKILNHFDFKTVVISRTDRNFYHIKKIFPNNLEFRLLKEIKTVISSNSFDFAINCVSIKNLHLVTKQLIKLGLNKILVEKTACLDIEEIDELIELSLRSKTKLKIALNRRHFDSVNFIKKELKNLQITSAHLDFTEWIKGIDFNKYDSKSLKFWLYSNSIHVIDLFFYLFGIPEKIDCVSEGENLLHWHPSSSIFSGNGKFNSKINFTYKADWNGPGRWAIELVSKKFKYILSPLEEVKKMNLNNFQIENALFDNNDDIEFKPGLKKMVNEFSIDNFKNFISLEDYKKTLLIINKIGNYK